MRTLTTARGQGSEDFKEVFDHLERCGWNVDPKEGKIRAQADGYWMKGYNVDVAIEFIPEHAVINTAFLIESDSPVVLYAQPLMSALEEEREGYPIFESTSTKSFTFRWSCRSRKLFEQKKPTTADSVLEIILEKGGFLALSCMFAIGQFLQENGGSSTPQQTTSPEQWRKFCLDGFQGIGRMIH